MYEILDNGLFPPFQHLLFAVEQVRPDRAALMTRRELEELKLPYVYAQNVERVAYELVLNAYQHVLGVDFADASDVPPPHSNIRLEVGTVDMRGETRIRVAVYDQSSPQTIQWTSVGKGLTIVRTVAPYYGCEAASPRGKVVWAAL
ncbi:hypothetical protein AB0C84_19580 [Actinomadura sp. NPDC048955]|uniref:hypothetical protein n=1 Tax=Actinomadura sp. NPDC048955 TaxID=3158228 RepID=UPI0033E04639